MDTETTDFRPPYMSFQTFWNFIEELAAKPLPPRLDRSLMKSKSGTDQNNLTMALTSFGLTDDEGKVQQALIDLVATPGAERQTAFGHLVRHYYTAPLAVSAQVGTTTDLNKAFIEEWPTIASADTRRKSVTFFLHAARAAGIELSPHFPQGRPGSGGPGASKATKRASRRRANQDSTTETNTPANPVGGGFTQTVTLKSGGTVTLAYNVNMFEVDDEDEAFVLGLIKKLRGYQPGTPADTNESGES